MSEYKQLISDGFQRIWAGIKKFFLIIIGTLILGGILYLWVMSWTYSEGSRAGYLVKTSRKGVVFKTYEGQLNVGGFNDNNGSGIIGNIWEFSVLKRNFYDDLKTHEGQHVKLYYKQRYKAMPWQGKTDYFVYKVEPVE